MNWVFSLSVRIKRLSDYRKLVPFTLKTRQSGVRDGHQSGACATTRGGFLSFAVPSMVAWSTASQ